MFSLSAQTPRKNSGADGPMDFILQGTVISASDGRPLQGVSVRVDAENRRISSKKDGSFTMPVQHRKGRVKFTYVGYKAQEAEYVTGIALTIYLQPLENQLDEVEVVSTGYQKIPKERATGSFEFVDNKLLNRKVSMDFLSRLEDVVPGLSANKMNGNRGDVPNINIRGIGSINSNIWPLIVIDGTSYENRNGDYGLATFNNLSADEIESITVLKDAAALSIWGAQSANGVLVITTKRGQFNSKGTLTFNTNITVKEKPDLGYFPQMNTSDYIDAQKLMFDRGRYPNSRFTNYMYNPQPILWLMYNQQKGLISPEQLNTELDKLRGLDMRDDFDRYIYRKAVDRQYSAQYKVGGEQVNNFTSVSYARSQNSPVSSSYERLNLKSAVQARPIKNLMVDMGISYVQSKAVDALDPIGYDRMGNGVANYPYMRLVDDAGNPVKLDIVQRNPIFRDTIAGGRLLNWDYVPLNELDASLQTQLLRETMLTLDAKYSFDFGLKAGAFYSYTRTNNPIHLNRTMDSYLLRNQINNMASWDASQVTWNYPLGATMQVNNWNTNNQQGRITMEYSRSWKEKHELNMLGGFELRQLVRNLTTSQYLGFDPGTGTSQPVHYGLRIRQFNGMGSYGTIRDLNRYEDFIDRYRSYFVNGNYSFKSRYILSGSFRKDASNLFGVNSNQRGQPFWSTGLAWIASKEPWLDNTGIGLLKFRATYGYNGNVNNSVTAYPIMTIQPVADLETGENYATIGSPPNPGLRWERVGVLNLGLDFGLLKNRLSGSVEYFRKNPKDLIAAAPVDPSTGYSTLVVNSANLLTKGWDLRLDAVPLRSNSFSWTSNLVFSYLRTKVTKSYLENNLSSNFVAGANALRITPMEGMDLFSLLTYRWAGLDPETGDPQGYVNGEVSKDYIAILGGSVHDMENHGSLVPLYFGGFRNSFRFKRIELSANISYQLGHKFQRNSFSNDYFINQGIGHSDYALRWQKPGDEKVTDVPSFKYPNNAMSSEFYVFSSALVENASQIKLRDIQISWMLPDIRPLRIRNVRLYAYLNNIGVIWRANKKGIDTEVGRDFPDPFSTSIGLNFNL